MKKIELNYFLLIFFYSILDHEQGETIPIVVRQTVDYVKNYGKQTLIIREMIVEFFSLYRT